MLSCPTTLQPCLLSSSIGGFLVPSLQRNNAIKPVVIPLLNPPPATPSKSRPTQDPTSPPSGSGLTPPSTPAAQPGLNRSVSGRSTKSISEASFSRSGTLVSGLRGMHSLLPSTLGSQIDSLLESNRVEDAVGLLSQAREKLEKSTGLVDEGEVSSLIGSSSVNLTPFTDPRNFAYSPTHCLSSSLCHRVRGCWETLSSWQDGPTAARSFVP